MNDPPWKPVHFPEAGIPLCIRLFNITSTSVEVFLHFGPLFLKLKTRRRVMC